MKLLRSLQPFFISSLLSLIICNSLSAIPQNVSELIITTQSKIDICCTTLGSQIDQLTNIVETNFAATFTSLAAISEGSCDLSGTYTALSAINAQDFTTQSKLDTCCIELVSKIDDIAINNTCALSGTYTLLNEVIAQETTTHSKIDLCCATLNSKIDALSGIIIADFAGTFTALADIRQEETTIESKVDALTNIVNADFAGTFTAIAAISGCDLSGTYTAINALGLCNAIPLSLTSTGTTISTPGVYCLTSDVALGANNTILINTSGVILDLNGHTISGATSAPAAITIGVVTNPNINRVIVRNGFMANAINSSSSGNAIAQVGIFIQTNMIIEDLNITGFNNVINLGNANDSIIRNVLITRGFTSAITFSGNNNLIENCYVEQMNGGAYNISGQNIKVLRSISYANGSGFSANALTILFDSCTASVHNAPPFNINLSPGAGLCSLINCVANDNTGAFNIIGTGQTNQASLLNCQSLRSGSFSPFNIQVSNCILDSCIAQYCIGVSGFSLGATPLSNCTLRNCVSNFSDLYGFDLLNTTSCTLENCIADKNTLSGFSLNNAAQCLIRNSVASNNSVNGFDGSAAGECCVIQDCTATNNLSFGFTGTDDNVSFYNNVANCNGTNFDEFSASSAQSGMLDSKVDALAQDFAGTFTVLANLSVGSCDLSGTYTLLNSSIEQDFTTQSKLDLCCATLNSKIDNLAALINTDMGGTSTSQCSACAPISINVPSTGTTISVAGVYCLTNNVALSSTSNTIAITTSNVILDLSGHTITGINSSGAVAISVSSSVTQVTIRNGTILNSDVGISFAADTSNTLISDVAIDGGTTALAMIHPIDAHIKNVIASNLLNGAGISLSSPYNCVIESCQTLNSSNTNGFALISNGATPSGNVNFKNCISDANSVGFSCDGIDGVILDSCQTLNCINGSGFGFFIDTSSILSGTINVTISHCISNTNVRGFYITNSSSGSASITVATLLAYCQGLGNTQGGFQIDGDNMQSLITHCVSQKNTRGFNLGALGINGCCNVENCTATCNQQDGFVGTGNNDAIFFTNQASGNTTNYVNLGTQSGSIQLFTDPINSRADNLRNVAP